MTGAADPPEAKSQEPEAGISFAVPLKDQSGNYITNQSAASTLTVEPNATCALAPGSAALSNPLSPSATGSTVLRYDTTNNQCVFNWDTTNQAKGCYNIVLKLADGMVKSTVVKLR